MKAKAALFEGSGVSQPPPVPSPPRSTPGEETVLPVKDDVMIQAAMSVKLWTECVPVMCICSTVFPLPTLQVIPV